MFNKYGNVEGYGQMAPGRDVEAAKNRRGQPNIQQAIQPQTGMNTPPGTFQGAQQTTQPQQSQLDKLVGGMSNTGVAGGVQRPVVDAAGQSIDKSKWNTDGFATPGYTASSFGPVLSGWDATKWNDPNHQTPKYVVGRILTEVGDLKNPDNRAAAISKIQQAYPGAQFNGKDKVTIPGVGTVDIFRGASVGEFGAAFQVEGAEGGGMANPMQPAGNLQQAILGTAPTVNGNNTNAIWQDIMRALQNDPQLKALAAPYGMK